MTLALDYALTGCANGVPAQLSGSGRLDVTTASLQVTVEGFESLHWDPAIAVLDALPVLITEALRPPATDDDAELPILGQTRSVLHDDQGREVGSSVCSFHSRREGIRLVHRAQLLECASRLEVLEHIISIDVPHQAVAMPGTGDTRILTHTFSFATSRGSSYVAAGMTTWRPATKAVDVSRLTIGVVDLRRSRSGVDGQVITAEATFTIDRLVAT